MLLVIIGECQCKYEVSAIPADYFLSAGELSRSQLMRERCVSKKGMKLRVKAAQ